MSNKEQNLNTLHKPHLHKANVGSSEFLLVVEAALLLAFEAGKWEGQVELEEHYDRNQFAEAFLEAAYARKNAMPLKDASTGRTVTVNLRSDKWREGVRKSAKEYVDKALAMVVSHYR